MKRTGWIICTVIIAVLLVGVETAIIAKASGYEQREKAVFARVPIGKNTAVTAEMLEVREIGESAVHPAALKSISEAVSKTSAVHIEAGEMLLKAKLSVDGRDIIEAEVKNNRLFCIKFEMDQANGWQLAEGQYVDLIYVPSHPEKQEELPAASGVTGTVPVSSGVKVLRNVRVAGLIDDQGKLADDTASNDIPAYVSFEVTQEQAVFLAYAKSNGKIEISCIP